jgi:serine/threonine protein kinase
VPCGTCDYISPEILLAHEEALVALEMTDEDQYVHGSRSASGEHDDTSGYGRETDWWSLGAMLYEMAYGVAPFFANDIRQTYLRIMDHEVISSLIR